MTAKSTDAGSDPAAAIDIYIANVPEPFRGALEKLRATIKSAAPKAEEAMIYGVPGFRHHGNLVCYAAFKAHCGFYPMSPALLDSLADELTGFRVAKGTIRFTPDQPLPAGLVRTIVTARLGENGAGTAT
ncbi:iron chaperone [Devosia sp.]|uniref:iron chaperone n=1 Tax=Devosia sp. TaxID=1871048 RepID=UPI002EDF03F0